MNLFIKTCEKDLITRDHADNVTELLFWCFIWDVGDVIGFKEGSEGRRL